MLEAKRVPAASLPQADLYIASLGRSGSTLVANLLTTPPDRFVLVEPYFPAGGGNAWMFEQFSRFGWTFTPEEQEAYHASLGNQPPGQRVATLLAERLAGLARWGVKEIDPRAHQPTLALIRPRQIVVLVRDVRDVVLSYLEKSRRDNKTAVGEDILRTVVDGTEALTTLVTTLRKGRVRVVRYEDFVSSADERAAVARWLNWPLDGDPNRNLDLYQRSFEISRHGGMVSAVSVGRRHHEGAAPGERALVERIADFLGAFQKSFGYE